MEIKIISEKQNVLFSRKEVQVEVKAEVTPSKEESKKIVANEFKAKEDFVRIRDIKGRFGVSIFVISADIYDSQEEFDRIVKKTKHEIEAEKKAEEEKIKAEEDAKKVAVEAKAAEEAAKAEAEKPAEAEVSVVEPQGVPSNEEADQVDLKEGKVKEEKSE